MFYNSELLDWVSSIPKLGNNISTLRNPQNWGDRLVF